MSGILNINHVKTSKIQSANDLILMANNASFMTLNASDNKIEFHANVDANAFDFTEIDITLGNVDNTPIGANVSSTGKFTTLESNTMDNTPIGLTTQRQGRFSSLTATGNAFLNGNCTTSGFSQLSGGLLVNGNATFNNEVSFNASVNFSDFDVGNLNVSNLVVENEANITKLGSALNMNSQIITNANLDSGEISGCNVNMTGKTLTLDNDSISGDKIQGGTIASVTITDLTSDTIQNGVGVLTLNATTDLKLRASASEDYMLLQHDNANIVAKKPTTIQNTFSSVKTPYNEGGHSADKVITSGQLLGGLWRGAPSSNKNLTFPSASDVVAEVKDCVVGTSWYFHVLNNSSGGGKDYTIISGTGMSYVSSGSGNHNKVGAGKGRMFMINITNIGSGTESYDVYVLGDMTPI